MSEPENKIIETYTYQPEKRWMSKDSIYAAAAALRIGIRNSQELLSLFDLKFGRTIIQNRITAERMEAEIKGMQTALEGLKKPNCEIEF